jgi:hypothetical protein
MAMGPMRPDGAGSQTSAPKPSKPTVFRPVAPPAPRYTPPVYSNPTGQYNSRPTPVPPSTPGPVPDINAYLGADSGYQGQLAALAKALSDFQADSTRRRGTLESDFAASDKALRGQRDQDLQAIKDDYGARGLLRSGLYGKALGDYETEFNTRIGDLSRKQAEALALLEQELGQFSSQQELAKQQAREAAIRRRAETYGV